MTKHGDDRDLRDYFETLRDEEARSAPDYRELRETGPRTAPPRPRLRPVLAGALALAAVVALAAVAVPRWWVNGPAVTDGIRLTEPRSPAAALRPQPMVIPEGSPSPAVSPAATTANADTAPRDEVPEAGGSALADRRGAAPDARSEDRHAARGTEETTRRVPRAETHATGASGAAVAVRVRVVDAADATPLPGASVVLGARGGGTGVTAVTGVDGTVSLPVAAGTADLSLAASMPGYATVVKDGIRAGNAPVVIALGESFTEVETLLASRFEKERKTGLEQTQTSTTFGDDFVQDAPVQGRFYTNVLTLEPGVRGGDGEPNVHGARERELETVVGGVSNSDPIFAGPGTESAFRRSGVAGVPPVLHQTPAVEPSGPESYAPVDDNPFHRVADEPLSTFSADVDTASYSNVRRFLRDGRRPPKDAVRIEELVNYFDYAHPKPVGSDPFGVDVEVADCPWNPSHRLARMTLAARRESRGEYAGSNLVFLIDVSGSMRPPNKLPLLKQAMGLLVDQLDGRDTVTLAVYAGASGLVLPPTPGSDRATILEALDRLEAGGSTAGAAGLQLAYEQARRNFVEGGVNRVILATDGDFNVGPTSHAELLDIIERDARRGVFLTVLGFGMGNLKDDRLERLADRGNGNYAYIDDLSEARKVLVEEIGGTLVTVAKDVKFQVEFNPLEVAAYRLIGYTNRLLAHRDFNDDTKDAGEVGAGHTVTVLYELVPAKEAGAAPAGDGGREVDPLRYREPGAPTAEAGTGELLTLKVRFKRPAESASELRTWPVRDDGRTLGGASDDFRFAAAVAAFGMRLRDDDAVAGFDWNAIRALAAGARAVDEHGHRAEFAGLVDAARDAR